MRLKFLKYSELSMNEYVVFLKFYCCVKILSIINVIVISFNAFLEIFVLDISVLSHIFKHYEIYKFNE
jgi:hypothetical protein